MIIRGTGDEQRSLRRDVGIERRSPCVESRSIGNEETLGGMAVRWKENGRCVTTSAIERRERRGELEERIRANGVRGARR